MLNGTESLERHRALPQKMQVSESLVSLEVLHSDHIAVQVFQSLDLSNVRGRASNTWYRMVTLPCTFFCFK